MTKKEQYAQVVATTKARLAAGATVFEAWSGLKYGRGVEVLPRHWVVERTFSWLGKSRRLSKDYEYLPGSSEAMAFLAMTRLMLKRLGGGEKPGPNAYILVSPMGTCPRCPLGRAYAVCLP